MTPASGMVSLDRGATMDSAIRLVRRSGHIHLPAYEGNLSNVVGTITLAPWDLLDPAGLRLNRCPST